MRTTIHNDLKDAILNCKRFLPFLNKKKNKLIYNKIIIDTSGGKVTFCNNEIKLFYVQAEFYIPGDEITVKNISGKHDFEII